MTRYSIREVIEMALQTEVLGYQFYTDMSEKFKEDEGMTSLFSKLAAMETKHKQIFTGLLDKLTTTENEESDVSGWEEAQSYMRAIVESKFFLGSEKSLPNMDGVNTVADAVDFAIAFEKETFMFFIGLRNAVSNKDAVQEIIDEEHSHIVWLSNFRESIKS